MPAEIMTSGAGIRFEGVLQQRANDFIGILNGVDYNQWNPAVDPLIAKQYSEESLEGKRLCKDNLQRTMGLAIKPDVPLFGIISRLTSQKGIDSIEKIFDTLIQRDVQFVLLGSGESRYEDFFHRAAAQFPGKVGVRIGFDEPLAHRIEAGADIFLMPSLL